MFDTWNQWTWVTVAWLQLVLAYGGYLAYLGWRQRQLLRADRAQRALDVAQRGASGPIDRASGGGRP